jgi:phage gp36-like protein
MPYCTPDDVRLALAPGEWDGSGPSAQPTNTAADLSDEQLADAITEADTTIDSYLSRYYATPVATDPDLQLTPEPVRSWSRDIAAYLGTLTWRKSKDISENDPVRLRVAQVFGMLTGVAQDKVSLALPPSPESPGQAGADQAINPYDGQLFDPSMFSLYGPNPGWPWLPDVPPPLPGIWTPYRGAWRW